MDGIELFLQIQPQFLGILNLQKLHRKHKKNCPARPQHPAGANHKGYPEILHHVRSQPLFLAELAGLGDVLLSHRFWVDVGRVSNHQGVALRALQRVPNEIRLLNVNRRRWIGRLERLDLILIQLDGVDLSRRLLQHLDEPSIPRRGLQHIGEVLLVSPQIVHHKPDHRFRRVVGACQFFFIHLFTLCNRRPYVLSDHPADYNIVILSTLPQDPPVKKFLKFLTLLT